MSLGYPVPIIASIAIAKIWHVAGGSRMSEYDRIAKAIAYISSHAGSQPSLDDVAAHVHLSAYHFQRLFARWAGISPKRFLQVLTLDMAKQLLRESRPLTEVSDAVGLSGASRLHDHFVQLEAVTPGEYRRYGIGLRIEYGIHDTPFGKVFVAVTPRGICALAFIGDEDRDLHVAELHLTWPQATIHENPGSTRPVIESIEKGGAADRPLSLFVSGTNFQINVWRALLRIPSGRVASYGDVAKAIGHPRSARAVGNAIGMNPVALLIPCHRVIAETGQLAGYRWGEDRKQAILTWEIARHER